MGSATFVEVILAILLPPVGVFFRFGLGVFALNIFNTTYCVCFTLDSKFFYFFSMGVYMGVCRRSRGLQSVIYTYIYICRVII